MGYIKIMLIFAINKGVKGVKGQYHPGWVQNYWLLTSPNSIH